MNDVYYTSYHSTNPSTRGGMRRGVIIRVFIGNTDQLLWYRASMATDTNKDMGAIHTISSLVLALGN